MAQPERSLPAWTTTALAEGNLSPWQREQIEWIGQVYTLMMDLNRYSLGDMYEQQGASDRLRTLSQRGMQLAMQAEALTQQLSEVAPDSE